MTSPFPARVYPAVSFLQPIDLSVSPLDDHHEPLPGRETSVGLKRHAGEGRESTQRDSDATGLRARASQGNLTRVPQLL